MESKNVVKPLDEFRAKLRTNSKAGWLFALSMGLIFSYIYGLAKNLLVAWIRTYFDALTVLDIDDAYFIIKINFSIDLVSSSIAAVVCGALLVHIFKEKAVAFCLGSILVFLMSSSRLWGFWKYPELAMQISGLLGPLTAALVFMIATCLILKLSRS